MNQNLGQNFSITQVPCPSDLKMGKFNVMYYDNNDLTSDPTILSSVDKLIFDIPVRVHTIVVAPFTKILINYSNCDRKKYSNDKNRCIMLIQETGNLVDSIIAMPILLLGQPNLRPGLLTPNPQIETFCGYSNNSNFSIILLIIILLIIASGIFVANGQKFQ